MELNDLYPYIVGGISFAWGYLAYSVYTSRRELKTWRDFAEKLVESKTQLLLASRDILDDSVQEAKAIRGAIIFIENAPYSFANGNTHMGMDEGEVLGNKARIKTLIELKEAVGDPLDDLEKTWKETFRVEEEKWTELQKEREIRMMARIEREKNEQHLDSDQSS